MRLKSLVRGLAAAAFLAALAGCASHPLMHLPISSLTPCPATPNCVSSSATDNHFIQPLEPIGSIDQTWLQLIEYLASDSSFAITARGDNYLRVTATTSLFRFVDDLEFLVVAGKNANGGTIAMRSGSRLGLSDLGTNRRRLEALRKHLSAAGVARAN